MAELRFIVPVNAVPDKIYAAVATQAGMRSWWTADTRMEEKIGGKAEFGFEKRGMIFRMTIDRLDPGRCVVMSCHGDQPEWNGTTLRWDIAKNEAGDGGHGLLRKLQRNVGKPNVPPQGQRRRKRPRAAVEGVAHSVIFGDRATTMSPSAVRLTAGSPG